MTRVIRRIALGLVAAGIALVVPGTVSGGASLVRDCSANSGHAAVVIEHGDGRTQRFCEPVDGSTTAEALLNQTGVETGYADYGAMGRAVCQIDSEPASYPPSCFTSTGSYWQLFIDHGAGWRISPSGASTARVAEGEAIGFRYNAQDGSGGAPPAPGGTCPTATAAATPAPATVAPATMRVPAGQSATPPASGSTAPAATAASAAATAAVAAVTTRAPASSPSGPIVAATHDTAPSLGLMLAAITAGGLLGLVALQILRGRRQQ